MAAPSAEFYFTGALVDFLMLHIDSQTGQIITKKWLLWILQFNSIEKEHANIVKTWKQ